MSIDTSSLAEPMATILDTFAGENALRQLEVDTRRDDLLELLEAHADHTDENDVVWIRADALADDLADDPDLLAAFCPIANDPTISHAYSGVLPRRAVEKSSAQTANERLRG